MREEEEEVSREEEEEEEQGVDKEMAGEEDPAITDVDEFESIRLLATIPGELD